MSRDCPNCYTNQFYETQQSINLQETLERWEHETSTKFRPETLVEYQNIDKSIFFKCRSCGFGAFSPAAAGTANFYNDITTDGDYYIHEKWEFIKTFELIKKYKISNLLDYGCGGGAFLKRAQEHFPTLHLDGFDQNPQTVKNFEGTSIGFTNDINHHGGKTYDMITAFQILEHLEDPFKELKTLHTSLKNDGIIIISVPNTDGPIRHFPDALTEIPPHHVNRFGKKSLEIYLQNAGFKVEEIAYEPLSRILWPFYLPVMVMNLIPNNLKFIYQKLRGPKFVSIFVNIINKTKLRALPVRGHSIYIVARKCAG